MQRAEVLDEIAAHMRHFLAEELQREVFLQTVKTALFVRGVNLEPTTLPMGSSSTAAFANSRA